MYISPLIIRGVCHVILLKDGFPPGGVTVCACRLCVDGLTQQQHPECLAYSVVLSVLPPLRTDCSEEPEGTALL